MKQTARILYLAVIVIVLVGYILDWFMHFSDEIDQFLDTALFCIIGIGYISMAFSRQNKFLKGLFAISGVYLIVMNFFEKDLVLTIIGIIFTVIPIVIAKIFPSKEEQEETMELRS